MAKIKSYLTFAFLILGLTNACAPQQGTDTPNPQFSEETTISYQVLAKGDTNTKQRYPNEVKGDSEKVDVWKYDGEDKIGYIKYDFSNVSQSSKVKRAVLKLWVFEVKNPGLIHFDVVHGRWDEMSLTYNKSTGLSIVPAFSHYFSKSDKGHYVELDVTDIVQDWISGSLINDGFSLIADQNSGSIRVEFHSKEAEYNRSFLEITLQEESTD